MRKPLSQIGSPPPVKPKKDDTIITQVREYELITPLFGGGVNPGEADSITVIRGTAIRGQLRFWWRACRGGRADGDIATLREIEGKLWGTAANKSEQTGQKGKTEPEGSQPVQISVDVIDSGTAIKPFTIVTNPNGRKRVAQNTQPATPPAYAAFPLQPKEEEIYQQALKLKEVQSNVKFKLTISFPANQRLEVEAALWAWETFGGLGARTRRGFGALKCKSIKENDQSSKDAVLPECNQTEVQKWLLDNAQRYVSNGTWPAAVPHLAKVLVQGTDFKLVFFQSTESSVVWSRLIDRLKNFRQWRRSPQDVRHPGRSEWPEPSAIRHLTGQSHPEHRNPIPNPLIAKFPRAVFGLPIIFHFKDQSQGDPTDTTLQSPDHERLASPLILRPLACKDGKAVGLALLLEGPRTPPGGLALLKKGNATPYPATTMLTPGEAKQILPLKNQPDVLKAFLNYL